MAGRAPARPAPMVYFSVSTLSAPTWLATVSCRILIAASTDVLGSVAIWPVAWPMPWTHAGYPSCSEGTSLEFGSASPNALLNGGAKFRKPGDLATVLLGGA